MPLFDGGPNPASAIAMSPVTLYGISRIDMETLLREHPGIAMNTIKVLAERVRHFISLVEDLSFRHVIGRVARLLMEYATDHSGLGQEASPKPRLTQQDMAAIVGTAREVVSRSLRTLESDGVIRMERHRIVIKDIESLKDMAGVST